MTYVNFECSKERCLRYASHDCLKCEHNVKRNCMTDNFEEHMDNDLRGLERKDGRFVAHLVGSAEHGGIVCPACGYSNNAYSFDNATRYECEKCGLPLLWSAK